MTPSEELPTDLTLTTKNKTLTQSRTYAQMSTQGVGVNANLVCHMDRHNYSTRKREFYPSKARDK